MIDSVMRPALRHSLTCAALTVCLVALQACSGCSDSTDRDERDDGATDLSDFDFDSTPQDAPEHPTDTADVTVTDVFDASTDATDASDALDITADTTPDLPSPDVAPDTSPHPPGLPDPCNRGQGHTLFEFHYTSGPRQSPVIDVWNATCSYSVANSSCQVQMIQQPSFNSSGDAVITTSAKKIRVRFAVDGLQFSNAWVHTNARSHSTTSSANLRLWSPLYGSKTSGPVDNDFQYDPHTTNWTGYLTPSDDPDLTAIDLYADSGQVAIHAVEVCVD